MTRQWIRKVKLTIGDSAEEVDVSQLRIRFKVEQNDIQRPNSAEIFVTNPKVETAKKFIKKEGVTVSLEAGYQEGWGLIFKGNVIQARYGRENPVETFLALVATSGDRAYNFSTVSKTLASGATFKDQVDVALQAMKPYGVTAGYITDLGSKQAPRALTLFGMARDLLRDVATSTGSSWSIQNQKLQILKNNETLPGKDFVVNSQTGMIGLPVQTIGGIIVRMLLNPQIVPGTKIKLDQGSVQEAAFSPNYTAAVQNSMIPSIAEDGFYKVLVSEHHGDTHGNPWYTEVVCTRADGQGPQPIGLANRGVDLDPGQN
ncbi:hypothetical protein [Bosea sp. AS-1]|uniref:phage protein n=1 Tax=Bosea sp. AS-1 TaxID=2015316 RepID=UPI000B791BCE|nr:hypothetical protein [Bosea sp. AS-1]